MGPQGKSEPMSPYGPGDRGLKSHRGQRFFLFQGPPGGKQTKVIR